MMGSSRRRPVRPRRKAFAPQRPDALEARTLLTGGPMAGGKIYNIGTLPPRSISHYSAPINVPRPIGSGPKQLLALDNEGRILSGKDRDGDEWFLTVHGPGTLIVTDVTPNDGALADELDTIRIIGSNPHTTYVTGQVVSSARIITDGTINFNRLIAERGVQSIVLNGFNLTNTTGPQYEGQPSNVGPEIYLPGGVRTLQFNAVNAVIDTAQSDQPFEIVIGSPNTPLRQKPRIKVGSIFNTVIDSETVPIPGGQPQTTPTVTVLINGPTARFEAVSATRGVIADAGAEYNLPVVSTTGRTALRTTAAGLVKLTGAARNFVVSRAGTPYQPQTGQPGIPVATAPTTVPFRSPNSGLRHLDRLEIGGPTDALGIDVEGRIGSIFLARGLGDPTGALPGDTNLGFNEAQRGYPSFGLLGGLIVAGEIDQIQVAPANLELLTPQDPDYMQLYRKGSTTFFNRPGNALTSAAIVTEGSIGDVHIVGDLQNSQISAGFDYASYVAGLEPMRSPSHIRSYFQRGSLIDSVVSASYSPGPDLIYGDAVPPDVPPPVTPDVVGPGSITGHVSGFRFFTGGTTALNYFGAGVYAQTKNGPLPPENPPTRDRDLTIRP
jgi:hypothetical protein